MTQEGRMNTCQFSNDRGCGHHVLKLPSKESRRSFCQLCYYWVGLAKARVKVTRTLLLPVFAWFLSIIFYSFTYKHFTHWPLSSSTSIPTFFTFSLSYLPISLFCAFFTLRFVYVMSGLIRTICLTVGLEPGWLSQGYTIKSSDSPSSRINLAIANAQGFRIQPHEQPLLLWLIVGWGPVLCGPSAWNVSYHELMNAMAVLSPESDISQAFTYVRALTSFLPPFLTLSFKCYRMKSLCVYALHSTFSK